MLILPHVIANILTVRLMERANALRTVLALKTAQLIATQTPSDNLYLANGPVNARTSKSMGNVNVRIIM